MPRIVNIIQKKIQILMDMRLFFLPSFFKLPGTVLYFFTFFQERPGTVLANLEIQSDALCSIFDNI
jgi:hypothetical protein